MDDTTESGHVLVEGLGFARVLDRFTGRHGTELLVEAVDGGLHTIQPYRAGWVDPTDGLTEREVDRRWPPFGHVPCTVSRTRVTDDEPTASSALPTGVAQWALVRWVDERRPHTTAIEVIGRATLLSGGESVYDASTLIVEEVPA